MSSPLDRIEDYAEAFLTGQRKRDVLALVNVAKAAERWARSERSDDIAQAARELREALAALNKEPA